MRRKRRLALRRIVGHFESCEEPAPASVARWALIQLASQAGKRGQHEEATLLASRALARADSDYQIGLQGNALLLRSAAHMGCGCVDSATEDLKEALSLLPRIDPFPSGATTAMVEFAKVAGAEQAAALIEESPSSIGGTAHGARQERQGSTRSRGSGRRYPQELSCSGGRDALTGSRGYCRADWGFNGSAHSHCNLYSIESTT